MLRLPDASKHFGRYLAEETAFDGLVLTGDISEGPEEARHHLKLFREGLGKALYFVMGNHDYYFSSFEKTHKLMSAEPGWLTVSRPVSLTPTVALVGNEGWYDAQFGHPYDRFNMRDWMDIQDLIGLTRECLIEKVARIGSQRAYQAELTLRAALETHEKVIFATHFPPFEGACWHEGGYSSPTFMPWFTSAFMGAMLLRQANAFPERKILVLCGHTHSFGVYDPTPNMKVITGKAVYRSPDLAGTLEIDGSSIYIKVKTPAMTDLGSF